MNIFQADVLMASLKNKNLDIESDNHVAMIIRLFEMIIRLFGIRVTICKKDFCKKDSYIYRDIFKYIFKITYKKAWERFSFVSDKFSMGIGYRGYIETPLNVRLEKYKVNKSIFNHYPSYKGVKYRYCDDLSETYPYSKAYHRKYGATRKMINKRVELVEFKNGFVEIIKIIPVKMNTENSIQKALRGNVI
jgi:hypothetical protein